MKKIELKCFVKLQQPKDPEVIHQNAHVDVRFRTRKGAKGSGQDEIEN